MPNKISSNFNAKNIFKEFWFASEFWDQTYSKSYCKLKNHIWYEINFTRLRIQNWISKNIIRHACFISWYNKSKLKPIRDKLCECNELKRLPISLQQLLHIYHKYINNWPTAVAGPCFHLLDENNQSKGLVVFTSNMHAEFCYFWSNTFIV